MKFSLQMRDSWQGANLLITVPAKKHKIPPPIQSPKSTLSSNQMNAHSSVFS